jgi:hypothetical protein
MEEQEGSSMITVTWESVPLVILTIATAVLGVARLARAITYDLFPPFVWWRNAWTRLTDGTDWPKLFSCWWCISFWIALVCVGWWVGSFYAAWAAWSWWIFWGSLALSYLAPMVIVRDGDESE